MGLGEKDTDSVFTRAFSVLVVEQILIVHQRVPFLSREEVEAVRAQLARYLAGERDRRGYVEGKGWAHAVAHAADALAVLAECPEIGREHLSGLLGLIRSQASAFDVPYLHDEDERLVTATVAAVRRRLLSPDEAKEWIGSFPAFEAREWSPQEYQRLNKKAFLRSLYFQAGKSEETRFMRPIIEEVLARPEAP